MSWRVTHRDAAGRRHQVELHHCSRLAAELLAEAMYGPALSLALICLDRRAA